MEEAKVAGSYGGWIAGQAAASKGERRRRLDHHGHAEKMFIELVWKHAVKGFDNLHAEWEVSDFRDGVRYVDYAYIRGFYKIAFEIDGYGPHLRDTDRRQFADSLLRQNHLVLDDWIVIRFSFDDIKERPRQCIQLIQQLLGKLYSIDIEDDCWLTVEQKEVIRMTMQKNAPITPSEVCRLLGRGNEYTRKLLRELVKRQYLSPASGSKRVRTYKLGDKRSNVK
ncbi:DNA-binding response regulator [Paenibacillus sp. NEAU-GSW1]|uniref:DNA-binding response regulator n=1 Tax=Paenibacillus sp. NEAU-GSW1 TaxID=2682486 RepID=UPI0012E22A92|nr:DNA-binding response regulator [Paenibacillus sp. NEAU-GSW1]MUT67168.1 DNA-binding response regulator [Paenibacillus sp. NEAU-GSW1]